MAPAATAAPPSAMAAQGVMTSTTGRRPAEKKYKCTFCSRAFSRSEHRSRHERSHTKERPFKCLKCKSTFVRRDLLLRHDRTVHAKDGGQPLQSESRKRSGPKTSPQQDDPSSDGNNFIANNNNDANMSTIGPHTDDESDIHAGAALLNDIQQRAMAQDPALHAHSVVEHDHHDHHNHHAGLSPLSPSRQQGNGGLHDHSDHAFGPQAMSLPQMPWTPGDSLMVSSSSMNPQFLHVSDAEGIQDPVAFINPELAQNHTDHLPQMFGHASSTDMGPYHVPASLSGIGTPGALSPFPSMIGPVSPVDYRRSPGAASQGLSVTKAPQISTEDQRSRILENVKDYDPDGSLQGILRLQKPSLLNRYLSMYFDLFHPHMPFLHPASFSATEVAAPLLLSVLSIGSLYCFDQDQAFMLHISSKMLVSQYLQNNEAFSSRNCPLWTMQATLINMIFASWSGDPTGLEWACSIKSLLANMVTGNRRELKLRVEARGDAPITHEDWIEDEGCRRSYYAAYVFFGMQTLTYNYEPQIGFSELEDLELPSSESVWVMGANDEAAWGESMLRTNILTFKGAYDKLIQGEVTSYSAFATRIMINALFLHVWLHKRSPNALQDVVTEYRIRNALECWHKSLDECEPETVIVNLPITPGKGHPLIFNAKAMYRNTRARLLVDLKAVQEALRYHVSFEVAACMTNSKALVVRSPEMLKVIEECYNCVWIPANEGVRWVARTSATSWSIEHPLCGLDLIVILSLWLWRIDNDDEAPSVEEHSMYLKIKTLFAHDVANGDGQGLSSVVAPIWGNMIDQVVVWGIAKLIGESFKIHAQALESDIPIPHESDMDAHDDLAVHGPTHQALELQTAY